jgi:hypothetical protein
MKGLKEVVEKYLPKEGDSVVEKTTFNSLFSAASWFSSLAWYQFVSTYVLGDDPKAVTDAISTANEAVDIFNSYKRHMGYVADVSGQFELLPEGIVVYYSGSGTMYFFIPDRDSVITMYRIKTESTRSEDDRWVQV